MIKTYAENNTLKAVIDRNLDNDISDIVDLIDLQHAFLTGKEEVLLFQFTDCDFINAAVAVIIGTIPEYAFKHDKKVKYRFSGKEEHPVLAFMKDVGLYEYNWRQFKWNGKQSAFYLPIFMRYTRTVCFILKVKSECLRPDTGSRKEAHLFFPYMIWDSEYQIKSGGI